MASFVIEGGHRLQGEIVPQGWERMTVLPLLSVKVYSVSLLGAVPGTAQPAKRIATAIKRQNSFFIICLKLLFSLQKGVPF